MFKATLAIAFIGSACAVAVYGINLSSVAKASSVVSRADAAHPVVLELFQSQGCSSCPPANAVLNEIANRPHVLALNFAVTYWDRLGWKDSFAQPAFTARQWDYARAGGRGNVQTPQLIVDGKAAILGSRKNEVEAAIARHMPDKAAPEIVADAAKVTIGEGSGGTATIWLVTYDPRSVNVAIGSGENGGRTLIHRNIVKQLTRFGSWTGQARTFALPTAPAGTARAVLVQTGIGGAIISSRKI
jgi:hypothetical protein